MFTDTEVALSMRYNAEVSDLARDAQGLINRKNAEIARLQKQLSAALADNETLRREKGVRAVADLAAIRALKKRHAH